MELNRLKFLYTNRQRHQNMVHQNNKTKLASINDVPSEVDIGNVTFKDALFCEQVAIPEALQGALAAPVYGSSLSQDLQRLANLLELRIY